MTALLYVLGVVVFAVAILVSIGLHELGHLIPAKRFGGKVTQYFVGFGPTLWSRRKGETEYGIKAIPLGGYVKIVGMLPPAKAKDGSAAEGDQPVYDADGNLLVRKSNTGMFTQLISDARSAEYEHIRPEDEPRLFYKLAWWKKVIVMAGGPTVNILIAFLLFGGLFATYGNPNDRPVEPQIHEVLDCVVPYAEVDRVCQPGDQVTPAKAAGLQAGDEFVSINGVPASDWERMQDVIRDNGDRPLQMVVLRDGKELRLEASTVVTARPVSADGEEVRDVGFLGVRPVIGDPTTGGPIYTLDQMGGMTVRTVEALGTLPVKVWGVAKAIVGVEERAADSPVSVVGGGRLAGETAAHQEIPSGSKIAFLVLIVASFNLFIGLFNFVPLLPLDGGHIAGALYEALRRGVARLRRKPDPGYVDVAKLLPVAYVVACCLLVMGVVLIVGDLVVPLHLPS